MGDNPIAAFRANGAQYITSTWQAAANRPTTGAPRTMHAPEMLVFPKSFPKSQVNSKGCTDEH